MMNHEMLLNLQINNKFYLQLVLEKEETIKG